MTTASRRPRNTSTHLGLRRELLDAVAMLLTQARSALFITGANMSADSGLSHYRGIPGLLRRKPEDGKLFEQALAIDTLRKKPSVTWKYLVDMEQQVRSAKPNRGHEILVALERDLQRSTTMTVNVDRLHQRAGSRSVIEMHGALYDLLCSACEISRRVESYDEIGVPPKCSTCGSVLRPDMPLFGEALPADPFTRLQEELERGFDLVFAIGVSSMHAYLARPLLVAKSEGIPTIEINPTPTDVSELVDFKFRGTPMRVLDLIYDSYKQMPRRTQPGESR